MAKAKTGRAALAAGKQHLEGGDNDAGDGKVTDLNQALGIPAAGDKPGEGRQTFALSEEQMAELEEARRADAAAPKGLEVAEDGKERAFWATVAEKLGFIATTVDWDEAEGDLNFTAWPAGTEERDFNPATNEADHNAAVERIEQLAQSVQFNDSTRIGRTLIDSMIDILRHRHKPWPAMTEIEKRDVQTAIDYAVKVELRAIVLALASEGKPSITAKLEKYADKAGEIVATLKIVGANDQTVLTLHRASGKVVMIVAADGDSLMGEAAEIEDDQAPLPFSAGTDVVEEEERDEEEEGEFAEQEAEGQALYDKAVKIVRATDQVSVSYLQRQLEIGFNLATQLVERMEREGVVSAPDVTTKRTVLPVGDSGEPGDKVDEAAPAAAETA